MQRIWLNSYPPGVPADVQVDRFASLPELFAWVCGRFHDRPAFSNQGATINWLRLEAQSRSFAAYLQHEAGMRKGDRIALMLPNLLQYPVALFGALRAGCVVVNVNPLYTPRELQHQLADSGATAIVVLDNFAHTLEQAKPATPVRHVITTRVGDMLPFPKGQIVNLVVKHVRHMVPEWHIGDAVRLPDALRKGETHKLDPVPLAGSDTAFLQYTGGTTGVPKGAILSHANILANIEQTAAWVTGVLEEGKETAIVPLPLYHVFALTATLTFCRLGAHIVLITNPRDIPGFIKELRHTPFSVMIGVNTLFNTLLNSPDLARVSGSGVKLVIAGGMAVQRAVAEKWQQVFHTPLIEGYGLTETSPIVCANPLNLDHFSGAVGLPLPSTDIAILDDEGNELPAGATGEIGVRGPQVMAGYWNMPDESAKVFTPGGWLRTGDIGSISDTGYVKIVDRKKDVIIVSGFKVYPNEIEDVVAMHPGVLESAAISAIDEHSNEVVKIVVVRRDPALTAEQLVEHCRKYLTAYKVPRRVVFRSDALPKSPVGKILRRVVSDEEAKAGTAAPSAPSAVS